MTISTTTSSIAYTGNGSTTAFAVPFAFFDAGDLQVVQRDILTGAETVMALSTSYTVSGGGGSSGTVTATTAPAATVTWTIRRVTAPTQLVDLPANGPFPADTVERAIDRVVAVVQEVRRDLARALLVPVTETATPLPSSKVRANKLLTFDAGGAPSVADIPGAGTSLTGDASLATVTPTGGNTARTLAQHLSQYPTPEDRGAVGNGSTDDWTAFQEVVNLFPGKTILLGNKSYLIGQPITASAPVSMRGVGMGAGPGNSQLDTNAGPGSRLYAAFATPTLFDITTVQPCVFRDMQVNVMPDYRAPASGAGFSIRAGSGSATNANTKFQNVCVANFHTGIYGLKPAWWTVEGCYFGEWINAAYMTETDGSAEASTGWVRGNYLFGRTNNTQGAGFYFRNGYVIIDGNEILGAQYGVLINAANNDAGFIHVIDNTIEEQYLGGIKVTATGTTNVAMVDIVDNEFSSDSTSASYLFSVLTDDAPARLWLKTLKVRGNTHRHRGAVSNGYVRLAAGANVLVADEKGENMGGGAATVFVSVNGLANTDCLSPDVEVLDCGTIGTFTNRYSFSSVALVTLRDQKPMTVAQLPTQVRDGTMLYVSDGQSTDSSNLIVIGGGSGCFALRQQGLWLTPGYIP